MSKPSKDYALTEARATDGTSLGVYDSPFLAAAREEEQLISEGFTPEVAHRIACTAHSWEV